MTNKKTTKPSRHKQAQERRRKETQRRRSQSPYQIEEQLWREMQPLAAQFKLDEDDENRYAFAASVMHDCAELYDEPEFDDLLFDPADAMHMLTLRLNMFAPSPEKFEQLAEEERDDLLSEAHIQTATEFVTSDLQSDVLSLLSRCRKRLKREKQMDKVALAAAVEWILRSDSRPEIWGTCGILHAALGVSLEEAFELEANKEEALKLAQTLQPEAEDVDDLEEGTAAYQAFWEAAEDTPGLSDYLARQMELADSDLGVAYQLDGPLAEELLELSEIKDFFDALMTKLEASGINLAEIEIISPTEKNAAAETVLEQISELIEARFPPARFQDMMADLEDILENKDEEEPSLVYRARVLHDDLSEGEFPYWQNPTFIQFLFNALLASMLSGGEDEEADDEL